jgi:hypothetical protein
MHYFLLIIRRAFLVVTLAAVCIPLIGQIKWDGGGGDGLWNTSTNWDSNIIPSATDDVLLDHSIVSENYTVTLPGGGALVAVRTLTLFPATTGTIEVILPVSNTAVPGFTATGSIYGLVIYPGGIFRNSSGASAGTPVSISDSIKINNGGLYIHNTARAHATNVMVLSRAPGTEQGSFEFDVPGGAGYTVSIAGRVYGNMILSAAAAGGAKSYTSTGVTTVNINGQFKLNPGVGYSLNFNGGFIIHGDFIHQGNVFDISGGANSNHVSVKKNIIQSGIIRESGTGLPVLEFDGVVNQNIAITGSVTDSITVRINNPAGITLQTPLSITYKLDLADGNVKTTSINLLIMQDNAGYTGGSINSFVDGPIRKIGDEDFIFPVGKQTDYAPASVTGTGGNPADEFEAEYFLGNPILAFGSGMEDPPIVRVSSLEYWKIERLGGMSSKKISLTVGTYSNATLLEKLVVSRWDLPGNIWRNALNTAYSGVATGTITSGDTQSFGVFTLASTIADQNPLPIQPIFFKAWNHGDDAFLFWQVDPDINPASFEILRSVDQIHFDVVKKIDTSSRRYNYQFSEKLLGRGIYYYKLKLTEKNGTIRFSNLVLISYQPDEIKFISVLPTITRNTTSITINVSENALVNLTVINTEGQLVRKSSTMVIGCATLRLDLSTLPAGIYYLTGTAKGKKAKTIRVVKL